MVNTTLKGDSEKKIVYSSPFIPAEWIVAHGLVPSRRTFMKNDRGLTNATPVNVEAGVCPYMRGFINQAAGDPDVRAIVLTTTCDQMRRAADFLKLRTTVPHFLMQVPSSCQTAAGGRLYRRELERLGKFLISLGGTQPDFDKLVSVMLEYDGKRRNLLSKQGTVSARNFAEDLLGFGETGNARRDSGKNLPVSPGVPVGFIGGPLIESHFELFDILFEFGATVVLNGAETGERTFPARFDLRRVKDDPLQVLAESYFGAFPDIFERPNNRIFLWMKNEIIDRDIRGVVFLRYLWCDKWHGEVQRFRKSVAVPLLDIELDGKQLGERTRNRIQAFVEALR